MTRKECFEAGKTFGALYGTEGRARLELRAELSGFEDLIDYLIDRAKEMGNPEDYTLGVLTSLGIVEGVEHFYE